MTSTLGSATNTAAMRSSSLRAEREYVPGRSTTSTVPWGVSKVPLRRSTVTPGQLPTWWRDPVRALKMVVFPQLGLPASARVVI